MRACCERTKGKTEAIWNSSVEALARGAMFSDRPLCAGAPWRIVYTVIEQPYRYFVTVTGVRSGRPIVEGTRIGVHDVVGLYMNGATVDEVVREFPMLSRAQVSECLAYYEDHRADIDLWVAEQMAGGSV